MAPVHPADPTTGSCDTGHPTREFLLAARSWPEHHGVRTLSNRPIVRDLPGCSGIRRGTEGAEVHMVAADRSGLRAGLGALAGFGVLVGGSALALTAQAGSATRVIETAALQAALADGSLVPPAVPGADRAQQRTADHLIHVRLPQGDGVWSPDGTRIEDPAPGTDSPRRPHRPRPLSLVLLGDSTSVGYGTTSVAELPGVVLAQAAAAHFGRPVRLSSLGLTGATTADLTRQLGAATTVAPDAVVILIGANDIRERVPPWRSAAQLGATVAALVAQGVPVVVGTCPDFGVIEAIPQPLRRMLSTWSHQLAAAQERAVTAAGGRAVPLGRLVSPQFAGRPELFAADHFHPSGPGYRRAMDVMVPALLDLWAPEPSSDRGRRSDSGTSAPQVA